MTFTIIDDLNGTTSEHTTWGDAADDLYELAKAQPERIFRIEDSEREIVPPPGYPLIDAALTEVREAQRMGLMQSKCVNCGMLGFYYPAPYAAGLGHCYSEEGMRDYTRITMMCEFCFDRIAREPDEDEAYEDRAAQQADEDLDYDLDIDDSHARIEDSFNQEKMDDDRLGS